MVTQRYVDQLTYKIIGCAIEVHKHLGPGLLESVYEKCFVHELLLQGLDCLTQAFLTLEYKDLVVDAALRIDVLVENLILVELKAVESFLPVHQAQVLSHMKLMRKPKGILLNFHCSNIFREGQKTFVNEHYEVLPKE